MSRRGGGPVDRRPGADPGWKRGRVLGPALQGPVPRQWPPACTPGPPAGQAFPQVLATVLMVQTSSGLSDFPAVQELRCKATGRLGSYDTAWAPSLLIYVRRRLHRSDERNHGAQERDPPAEQHRRSAEPPDERLSPVQTPCRPVGRALRTDRPCSQRVGQDAGRPRIAVVFVEPC